MISIDGSHGEGGGQILRTAVALAVVTKTPVRVTHIRANRPNPGIKPQHFTALQIIKELCDAETEGLRIGSDSLTFIPGEIKGGTYRFDIGTAGSIVLVFQACLLAGVHTSEPIRLYLKGGTDVKWSPSWDYFTSVFLPVMRAMGVSADAKLLRRGYYPEGGGEAEINIKPLKRLRPLQLDRFVRCEKVEGIVHVTNLPEHIGKRMKHAALKTFVSKGLNAHIQVDRGSSSSTGTGITVWTACDHVHLGKAALGEKGVPAEAVGEKAAEGVLSELNAHATVDVNLFDQLVPYMVLTDQSGVSACRVREISRHAETGIWLVSRFFDRDDLFAVKKVDGVYHVEAAGVGCL